MFAAVHGPRPLSLFAPSRPAALVNEVLWAWWGHAVAPDLVLSPVPDKPASCPAPCCYPCALACPSLIRPAAPAAGGSRGGREGVGPKAPA